MKQHFNILLTLEQPDGSEPYTREQVAKAVRRLGLGIVQVDEIHEDTPVGPPPYPGDEGAGSEYGMEVGRG